MSSNSNQGILHHHGKTSNSKQSSSDVDDLVNMGIIPSYSSNWIDETDAGYSHELARRSVARAALHLGIESMASDALDAMGDVLISFLERVGFTMAQSVEASNRSSAHCNILDALHAVESCTAPAASQVNLVVNNGGSSSVVGGTTNATSSSSNGNIIHNNATSSIAGGVGGADGGVEWEAFAEFAFGPNWKRYKSPSSLQQQQQQSQPIPQQQILNGNRNGNSSSTGMNGGTMTDVNTVITNGRNIHNSTSTTNNNNTTNNNTNQPVELGGWNAPYLDVVPEYPLTHRHGNHDVKHTSFSKSASNSNNAQLTNRDAACLPLATPKDEKLQSTQKSQAAEDRASKEADDIPDEFFFVWGVTPSSSSSTAGGANSAADVTKNGNNGDDAKQKNKDGGNTATDGSNGTNEQTSTPSPEKKRVKFDMNLNSSNNKNLVPHVPGGAIPSFLPPYPPAHTYKLLDAPSTAATDATLNLGNNENKRGVSPYSSGIGGGGAGGRRIRKRSRDGDDDMMDDGGEGGGGRTAADGSQSVRHSLVRMGASSSSSSSSSVVPSSNSQGYWGTTDASGMPQPTQASNNASDATTTTTATPAKSSLNANADAATNDLLEGIVPPGGPTHPSGSTTPVAPLVRASGSRISRILEGSMDAAV